MIHATELRIGNWVFFTGNGDNNPCPVTEITKGEIIVDYVGNKLSLFCKEDSLQPIPLSPEILEKCGWGKSDEHEMGMNTLNENNDGLYYDYHFKRFRMDFGQDDNIRMPHIQYLHQLQNLIHALTGEELTVKL